MKDAAFDINDAFAFYKVLFLGRTLSEYTQMFNVDVHGLKGKRLLDCPSEPASTLETEPESPRSRRMCE